MKIIVKNKELVILSIVTALTCLILSMAIFMQFKLVNNAQTTDIESMRKSELTTEIADLKQKNKDLQKQCDQIRESISNYNSSSKNDQETKKLLLKEDEELQKILGLTDVEGPGIKIIIDDEANSNKITEENLILLINNLKDAGAEAISINNNRIVNLSDIVYIDNAIGYIKINQNEVFTPYEILAIGDSQKLETQISQIGGEINNLRQLDIDVTISRENKIEINKYNGTYESQYLKKDG